MYKYLLKIINFSHFNINDALRKPTTKENLILPGGDIMDEPIYGDIYTVDTSGSTIMCG